jgi:hypothetical protein
MAQQQGAEEVADRERQDEDAGSGLLNVVELGQD